MFTAFVSSLNRARRTFPDILIANNVMIEIKHVQQIALTPQIEAQITACAANGLNYRLILSDVLQGDIPQDLVRALQKSGVNAKIQVFDNTLRKLVQRWP